MVGMDARGWRLRECLRMLWGQGFIESIVFLRRFWRMGKLLVTRLGMGTSY
jgi:hypothetical protein